MAAQELRNEVRMTMTPDARLKLESLKNKLHCTSLSEVLVQAVVLLDFVVGVEKKGGRLLFEVPGEETTTIRILSYATPVDSSPATDNSHGSEGTDQPPDGSSGQRPLDGGNAGNPAIDHPS